MKRSVVLILFPIMLGLSAGLASADPFSDDVVTQLQRQGFGSITRQSTWLGRMQIDANRADGQREIVLNPRTGEILRDDWKPKDGTARTKSIVDDVPTSSGEDTRSGNAEGGGSGSESGSDGSGSESGSGSGSGSSGSSGSGSGSSGGSGSDHDSGSDGGGDDK